MAIEKIKKIYHKAREIMILTPSGKKIKKPLVDSRTTLIPIRGDLKIIDENIKLKKMVEENDETISKLKKDMAELEKIIDGNIYKRELDILKKRFEVTCVSLNKPTNIIVCGRRIKDNKCSRNCRTVKNYLIDLGFKF